MKKKSVAIIGLGYVGLPLALLAARKGWQVVGVDTNQTKVDHIQAGRSPFEDKNITKELKSKPFPATTDASAVADVSVIVIAVPTPVHENHQPDLDPLIGALTSIAPHLVAGQTVIIESTINPGVMEEAVVPTLAAGTKVALDANGAAKDVIYLAHCPERVNPGDPKWSVANIPRVIGAYSDAGMKHAHGFYTSILSAPIKKMGSVAEAEAVKILENTFRDINIAFINEMAKSFAKLDIDITNVIAGAATKPFAFMPHYPGNGVGGHCISVDPYYMIERARQVGFDHEFLKLARSINDTMPAYAVDQLVQGLSFAGLSATTPIALLGLAYKKNIDDIRESPALEIQNLLGVKKFNVRVWDPYLPKLSTVASLDEAVAGGAVIMLATDHADFVKKLTVQYLKKHGIVLVVDGKNALPGPELAKVGIAYYGIGRRYLPGGTSVES
jgi:UDP-N-acetyl-D-glucosamine dehydrogenase